MRLGIIAIMLVLIAFDSARIAGYLSRIAENTKPVQISCAPGMELPVDPR